MLSHWDFSILVVAGAASAERGPVVPRANHPRLRRRQPTVHGWGSGRVQNEREEPVQSVAAVKARRSRPRAVAPSSASRSTRSIGANSRCAGSLRTAGNPQKSWAERAALKALRPLWRVRLETVGLAIPFGNLDRACTPGERYHRDGQQHGPLSWCFENPALFPMVDKRSGRYRSAHASPARCSRAYGPARYHYRCRCRP